MILLNCSPSPKIILLFSVIMIQAHFIFAEEDLLTKEDYLVNNLEEFEPSFRSFHGEIYAGQIGAEKNDKLYFMLFDQKPYKTFDDTLIVWLNGGPGCSSFAGGLFFELGPVTVPHHPAGSSSTKSEPFVPNQYAWTNASTVLFLEQPAGVGFSTGDEPMNEDDVSSSFYSFLLHFYDLFGSEYQNKKLYIFGESYAGMYIPSMAHKIHTKNKHSKEKVKLAGIGIGNGWFDARVQGDTMIDYAYWHGMIDSKTRDTLHEDFQICLKGGKLKPSPPFHSFTTPDECGIMTAILEASGAGVLEGFSPNVYDVTTWDTDPLILGGTTIDSFFNNIDIRKVLHVPSNALKWEQCIPGAGRRRRLMLLDDDKPVSVIPYIAELLDAGIDVLIYSGDRDMSCNVQGIETVLKEMSWSGQSGWSNSERGLWLKNRQDVAGYVKAHKNLQFVTVYNSGHLVPYNQPENALDMLVRFLAGTSFEDAALPSYPSTKKKEKHSRFIIGLFWFMAGIICSIAYDRFIRQKESYDTIITL